MGRQGHVLRGRQLLALSERDRGRRGAQRARFRCALRRARPPAHARPQNKLDYTRLHNEFKTIVEELIDDSLESLGVSAELFASACETGRDRRGANRYVCVAAPPSRRRRRRLTPCLTPPTHRYEQIVALDDFLTFKKMMVKRNVELEYEAVRELQQANVPISAPTSEAEAEAMFQVRSQ